MAHQTAAVCRIVIHRIGIHDQILIGEYRNIGFPDIFQHIRKSIGIHRRNDKRSHLFFQHVPDLQHLPGYIALGVADHRLVTILFQTALEGLRVAGPFFFVRKKHRHFLYILRFLIAVLLLCLFRICGFLFIGGSGFVFLLFIAGIFLIRIVGIIFPVHFRILCLLAVLGKFSRSFPFCLGAFTGGFRRLIRPASAHRNGSNT